MDSTAKALLELCRQRASLLRSALEALVESVPSAQWCAWARHVVDAVEAEINAQEEDYGRDSE